MLGLGHFLDDEGVVCVEEDVALLEEPEKISGVFCRRGGGTFREDGFPQAFEFRGGVLAYPFHHFRRARREHGIRSEGMRPGGAGVEFAFSLENGHVLGFENLADQRDDDGGVLVVMVAGAFQADKQARGKVLAGDGCGDLGLACDVESFLQDVGDEAALEFSAIGEPFVLGGGLGFSGRIRGFFACFGRFVGCFRGDFGGAFALSRCVCSFLRCGWFLRRRFRDWGVRCGRLGDSFAAFCWLFGCGFFGFWSVGSGRLCRAFICVL